MKSIKARVNKAHNSIEVFAAGKWRGVRYYQGSRQRPGSKVQEEVATTVAINTGLPAASVTFEWLEPVV